jgi:hypothetical protein
MKGFVPSFQFTPSKDRPYALYGDTAMVSAKIWQPISLGCTGLRDYNYHDKPSDVYTPGLHARIGNYGVRHYITSEQYITVALDYNLIHRFEKYLLQPRLNSPDYGPMFYTAQRAGSFGNFLMIGSLSEMPYPSTGSPMTINLADCRQAGGTINRYRKTPRRVRVSVLVGNPTTDTVIFNDKGEAGEQIFYTCQPIGAISDVDLMPFNPPANLPNGASKYLVKVGYYPYAIDDADAVDCTFGCLIPVDHSSVNAWYKEIYLDSNNVKRSEGEVIVITAQNPT